MIPLSFHTVFTMPYPETTTGMGSAMTVCRITGDPFLVFLTQTSLDDLVNYIALDLSTVVNQRSLGLGQQLVSGMGFNPVTERIWTSNTTTQSTRIFAFDPATHAITNSFQVADPAALFGGAFGTNGLVFLRSQRNRVELRGMGGALLGERDYPGRVITGISAAPLSWLYCDASAHQLLVVGPLGDVIAEAPCPGPVRGGQVGPDDGVQAVAFDTVRSPGTIMPALWNAGVIDADPGPAAPWPGPAPEPWWNPHMIYVANNSDQTIYGGYFIDVP
jgi:hypothetical protein